MHNVPKVPQEFMFNIDATSMDPDLIKFTSRERVCKGYERLATSKGWMALGERETEVIGNADPEQSVNTGNGMFSPGVADKTQDDYGVGRVDC